MAELGNTLSRARRARGITLEEVERDTHVSKRYLEALESEDFSPFPAPVYARGFLRTYSRYLGLNPDELVRIFPNGSLTVDIAPLPAVVRPPAQLISVNWVVAGLGLLFLLAAGLLLLRSGDGPGAIADSGLQVNGTTAGAASPLAPDLPGGAVTVDGPAQGKPIGPIRPGRLPDFVAADVPSAVAVLQDNQVHYVIIEVPSAEVPAGIVISQAPDAGADAGPGSAVTLVVSRGAAPN